MSGAKSFPFLMESMDSTIVRDNERYHRRFARLLLHNLLDRPLPIIFILLLDDLAHLVSRRDLQVDDNFPLLVSGVSSEPHQIGLQFRSNNSTFALPLIGPPMFSPDGDLITGGPDHLPLFPLLLVGYQSSLGEDVVQEDVHHKVMAGVDLTTHLPTAASNMLGVEMKSCVSAPTPGLSLLFGDELSPLPDTQEVLLYLPDELHRLCGAVQGIPRFPEQPRVDQTSTGDDLFRNCEDFVFSN